MAIARRRAAAASTKEAYFAMRELAQLQSQYRRAGDDLGQLRCGFEYVRGHVDFLSYWRGNRSDTDRSLRVARKWLDNLGEIAETVPDPAWRERERLLRKRLQLAAAQIVRRDGDVVLIRDSAELASGKTAEPNSQDENNTMRTDLPSSRTEELAVEKQILLVLDRMSREASRSVVKESIATLERALQRMVEEPDPVVQSECRLVLAQVRLASVDFAGARAELEKWQPRAGDIENAYLHRMARSIEEALDEGIQPFVIRSDAETLEWKKWERELRLWLARAAKQRRGPKASGKAVAETLGIDASSWSRWPK
jgi:hypothetical protein